MLNYCVIDVLEAWKFYATGGSNLKDDVSPSYMSGWVLNQ